MKYDMKNMNKIATFPKQSDKLKTDAYNALIDELIEKGLLVPSKGHLPIGDAFTTINPYSGEVTKW